MTHPQQRLDLEAPSARPTVARRNGKSEADQTLRITRLQLANWRNFTRLDVQFTQRVFLVGPNASGKSNLLDAIRFLKDIVEVGGGFQAAVQHRRGVSRLRSLAARRYPDVSIEVAIGTDAQPAIWHYAIAFGQDNLRRPLVKRETVTHRDQVVLARPNNRMPRTRRARGRHSSNRSTSTRAFGQSLTSCAA